MAHTLPTVDEPFPISKIAGRYLLFDVDTISYVRREHNIAGVLIGTIPNLSQQNVFLGAPCQLMPEEARVLVENGHAFIVDDAEQHRQGMLGLSREDRLKFLQEMDRQGWKKAKEDKSKAEGRREKALKEKGLDKLLKEGSEAGDSTATVDGDRQKATEAEEGDNLLFERAPSPVPSTVANLTKPIQSQKQWVTPLTSHPPLPTPTPSSEFALPRSIGHPLFRHLHSKNFFVLPTPSLNFHYSIYPCDPLRYHSRFVAKPPLPAASPDSHLPEVPKSYPLFRYLHSQGYFCLPGLRFGCHYSVYPGDPLRYHSHFLATGLGWDEEFDLLDLVGGGRLGTGVKKAYMIGAEAPPERRSGGKKEDEGKGEEDSSEEREVRVFTIEWAGM